MDDVWGARTSFTVVAPICPEPMGRPRARVVHRNGKPGVSMYVPAKVKAWQEAFQEHAIGVLGSRVFDEPIGLDLLAVFPRPESLCRKKDPDASALAWKATRPDEDNIRKNVLDALSPWLKDDARVVSGHTWKVYAGAHQKRDAQTIVRIYRALPFPIQEDGLRRLARHLTVYDGGRR